MSGYVDDFFTHILDYLYQFTDIEIIKYLLSFYIVIVVIGLFRKLLQVNR